jgi:hypothetical protein
MKLRGLGVLLLCFVASAAATAAVYRWVDDNGQVHYGEKPPHDDAQELNLRAAPARDADLDQRRQQQQKLLRAYEEERAIERREQQEAQRRKAEHQSYCRRARADLENALNSSALYTRDGSGEKRFLSKPERREYEAQLQAEVERYCR